ncbi:MAG TPA: heparan-alpha-glucosaminide N-acetyltransferase domain-containing protein [Candidatus Acidoferrales bacterium]|nr:heparan-alpha-glucosaminide N-acetyltransferase domain-containing protein [Candidatus Acidoferrales bacterium]
MSNLYLEPMIHEHTPAKPRVFIIDLARGLAVFFMIGVHTLWMLGSHHLQTETGFGHWVHLMGQGASAFLITMGFSFMVTPDRRLSRAFERGVFILLVAYLMNALKFLVPIYVFGTMPEAFIAAYGWQSPIGVGQAAYLLGTGDILQMAGVSLFLIGLVRRFIPNKYGILALMVASIGVSALLRGTRVGHPAPDYVLDLLWGTQWNVYFPVFPWIAHILAGMFLGGVYLEHGRDERALVRAAGTLGLVLLVVGWAVSRRDWTYHFNDFFHTGPGGTIYLIGRALCVFYVAARLLALRPLPAWFRSGVNYLSTHVTTLYVVQWTLICWVMGIVGYQTLGLGQTLAMMPVMIVATLTAEYAWRWCWQWPRRAWTRAGGYEPKRARMKRADGASGL